MKQSITLFFLFLATLSYTQTSLTQGDIAFLGLNLDGIDDYSFVLLKDIDANTTINFTDCGWSDGASSFVCNTGDANGWTWTSAANLSIGQTVTITVNGPGLTASTGSVSGAAGVVSSIGDQIFAYQGAAATPTFIAGIHSNETSTDGNWSGDVTNNQTSALPDVLTNGVNAIRLHNGGSEVDNWRYNCAVVSGDVTTVRNAINNISNWVNNNSTAFSPIDPGCSWSITALPIELISFEIKEEGEKGIRINWNTATETNNDYFTIEKSKDARNWVEVAVIDGLGTSFSENSYQVYDEYPYFALSYYRLKQTDFDGKFEYTAMRSIYISKQMNFPIRIYPNPTYGEITVSGTLLEKHELSVHNVLGGNVSNKVEIGGNNEEEILIDLTNLPSGIYLIKTKMGVNKVYKE